MAALDLDQPSFHGKNSGRTLPRRNARWSERRAVLYQRPPSGEFARVLEMTEDQDARGPGEEAPHRCEGHRITDIRHAGLLRLRRREQTARGAVGSWNWGAGASFIHQLYAPEVQSPGRTERQGICPDLRWAYRRLRSRLSGPCRGILLLGDRVALDHTQELLRALLLRVGQHVFRTTLFDDLTVVHEYHPVRDLTCESRYRSACSPTSRRPPASNARRRPRS